MRAFLSIGALALAAAFANPASAQMCGGEKAGGSSSMCGGSGATSAPAMDGTAPMEGQAAQAKKSGCSCCQNMAMMMPKPADDGAAPMMEMPKPAPETAPQ